MEAVLAGKRIWIPYLLAGLCLIATTWTGPVVTVVLILSAFGLVLDGTTTWWSRSGGLTQHRQ